MAGSSIKKKDLYIGMRLRWTLPPTYDYEVIGFRINAQGEECCVLANLRSGDFIQAYEVLNFHSYWEEIDDDPL